MKICDSPARLNQELARHAGRSVVFTNGVFDLLHPGHIELLCFAKQQGDILVVGVNDDDSVRRLKGGKRPIFPLAERMEVLAAIAAVDYVVPFAEDTPLALIKGMARIDVLVKGGDYRPHEIVGRDEVLALGGKVLSLPFNSGYSSSGLIQKIVDASPTR